MAWAEVIRSKESTLKGELFWADQSRAVEFVYQVTAKEKDITVMSSFDSKFSWFGIKPPSIIGGLVAKVYDELSLHSIIDVAQIQDKDGVIASILEKL